MAVEIESVLNSPHEYRAFLKVTRACSQYFLNPEIPKHTGAETYCGFSPVKYAVKKT
jgi:hypothetical protein